MLNYIRKEDLPGDLLGNLEVASKNAAIDFLNGNSSVASPEVGILNNASIIANTVTDKELLKKITKDLIDYSVQLTKEELTAYISDKTTELLDFNKMTGVLAESVTYWTKEKMMSPAEILDKIQTKNVSEEAEKAREETKQSTISNLKDSGSSTFGTVKDYAENIINSLDSGISTITAYISRGPDWVISNANTYVSLAIHKAESFIGEQVNNAINARNAAIDALGEEIGGATAEVTNQIALNTAKKTKASSEAMISQTQTKAMNAITKAIMLVRQITGVAVPPVYPPMPKLTDLF